MFVTEKVAISTFIKFGAEEHIRDLYENGTIYCQSTDIFKAIEDNDLRGDIWEGKESVKTLSENEWLKLDLYQKDKFIGSLTPTFAQFFKNRTVSGGNLYCLYVIKPTDLAKDKRFQIDLKNKKFGSHFIVIKNNQEFIERIFAALAVGNYKYQSGFVEYIDEKYSGELTPFLKRRKYGFQKEFRLYIENKTSDPIILNIGSLKDISMVLESDYLEKFSFKPVTI